MEKKVTRVSASRIKYEELCNKIEKVSTVVLDCHDGWHKKMEELREKRNYEFTGLEILIKQLTSKFQEQREKYTEDKEILQNLIFSNKIIISLGSVICILNSMLLYRLLTLI